jgi:hypothetical protein
MEKVIPSQLQHDSTREISPPYSLQQLHGDVDVGQGTLLENRAILQQVAGLRHSKI